MKGNWINDNFTGWNIEELKNGEIKEGKYIN